jgi:hypothetical protein
MFPETKSILQQKADIGDRVMVKTQILVNKGKSMNAKLAPNTTDLWS